MMREAAAERARVASRKRYAANLEVERKKGRSYYERNKEKAREYYQKNKEKLVAQSVAYKKANPDRVKKGKPRKKCPIKARESKKRQLLKPGHKAKYNLRNRFRQLMKRVKKGGTLNFSKMVGCTTAELALHLESKFTPEMAWGNYGIHWHVDHIHPVASFDHFDPDQVRQCWHYSNLQPLEARENLLKGSRIPVGSE